MDLGRIGNGISALGLLSCTFVLRGIAGYRAAHTTASLRSSAMAGLWSAIVTMSVLILLGFILEFYLAAWSGMCCCVGRVQVKRLDRHTRI